MQNQPLVTVYIPTFNRVELLKRAVKSVQDQTYQNLEIIIVDDCSTDGTHEYLKQVSKEDNRVRYFLKEKNSGACVSRNIAIENAKGEFITGLDDDDYFQAERIELFVKSYEYDELLFTNITILESNKIKKIRKWKKNVKATDLLFNNYIGNQVFTELKILKEFGGFDLEMQIWQDFEAWFNILKNGKYNARLISNYSYVLDVQHELGRITTSKKLKLNIAYQYFCNKHELNSFERKILYTNLYNYDPKLLNRKMIFLKLIYGFNFYDLKKFIFGI